MWYTCLTPKVKAQYSNLHEGLWEDLTVISALHFAVINVVLQTAFI